MELFHYISQTPTPVDAPSVNNTRKHLEGCNKIFERGLLCHTKIKDIKAVNCLRVLMMATCMYFNSLCVIDFICSLFFFTDQAFNPCDVKQKKFPSWQSKSLILSINYAFHSHGSGYNCLYILILAAWDNLRIDVFGYKLLCEDFFKRYPGYYLVPLLVSGSAVETLFSQYKYISVDSVNYTTAQQDSHI